MMMGVRETIRSSVPWWAKCALKLTLAKLPVRYGALRAVGLARHGQMDQPDFAYDAFRRHYDSANFNRKSGGFTMLELGPGDSLFMALISKAHGHASSCHVDVGSFVKEDVSGFAAMETYLRERRLDPPDMSKPRTISEVLSACNSRYEIKGLESLRALPDESIDFIFSNVVLQALSNDELRETLKELRRVLHPKGASVHSVDLRDMMGLSLNHLRFSDETWESPRFRNAGFYTNRLRLSELVAMCKESGHKVELPEVNRWPKMPIQRKSMAMPYREMDEEDLRVSTIRINLFPAKAAKGAAL